MLLQTRQEWTFGDVVERIQEWHPLTHAQMMADDPKFVRAGVLHYGSWGNAVDESGFDYDEILREGIQPGLNPPASGVEVARRKLRPRMMPRRGIGEPRRRRAGTSPARCG